MSMYNISSTSVWLYHIILTFSFLSKLICVSYESREGLTYASTCVRSGKYKRKLLEGGSYTHVIRCRHSSQACCNWDNVPLWSYFGTAVPATVHMWFKASSAASLFLLSGCYGNFACPTMHCMDSDTFNGTCQGHYVFCPSQF